MRKKSLLVNLLAIAMLFVFFVGPGFAETIKDIGTINHIGDNGDGSGNFNATRFMESLSSNINNALDSYKEVKETMEEREAKEAKEGKQVNAEPALDSLA